MIRIIIQRDDANMAANAGGAVLTTYQTIDIDAPEVEAALANTGNSLCHAQIIGAEVLRPVEAVERELERREKCSD